MQSVCQRLLLIVVLGLSSAVCAMDQEESDKQELKRLRHTFALIHGDEEHSKEGNSLPEGPLRAFFRNADNQVKAYFDGQQFYNDHLPKNMAALRDSLKRRLSKVRKNIDYMVPESVDE